jgi:hypothetical protein
MPKSEAVDVEEVVRLFESIQHAFPQLTMRLERQHEHVELNMDIPRQPGLIFDVNVNLQGDELHLGAGPLWYTWFPCTDPQRVAEFREAVHGVLSGRFRIVEHLRGRRTVGAELQRPGHDGWEWVGGFRKLHLPLGPRSTRVLQNPSGTDAV